MKKLVAMLGSIVLGLGGVGSSVYARTVEVNNSSEDIPWEEQFSEANGWVRFADGVESRDYLVRVRNLMNDFLDSTHCSKGDALNIVQPALLNALAQDCYVAPVGSETRKWFGLGAKTYSVFVNERNVRKLENHFPRFINALQEYMNLDNSKKNGSVEAKKYVGIINNCLKNFPDATKENLTDALVKHGVNLSQ